MQSYFDQYIQAGGVMMFVLIPLSALTLGFILQGFISLRPSRIVPQGLVDAAKGVTTPTDYAAFRQGLPSLPHILARVTLGYLEAAEKGEPCHPEENPGPLDAAVDQMYHQITPLGVIYTIAPLIGLLGTILGMMNTFLAFQLNQDIEVLSEGIMKALVTTMWGLMIAIPAYVFAAVLRNKIFDYEKNAIPAAVVEVMAVCAPFAAQKAKQPVPAPESSAEEG